MAFFAGGLSLSLLIASTRAAHIQVRDAIDVASNLTSNSTTNSSAGSSTSSSSSSSLSSLGTLSSSSITSSSSSAFSSSGTLTSSSTSSRSTSEASVGNYIAQGLGLHSSKSSTIGSGSLSTLASSIVANASTHHPANDFVSLTTASSSPANASSIPASITDTASFGNATGIPTSSIGGNYTVNPANKTAVDICYSSWEYWWQTAEHDTSPGTPYTTVYVGTEYAETTYTTVETDTVFYTLGNGAFPTRTLTSVFINTDTDYTELTNSPTGTSYDTEIITPGITSPTPNCVLPSSVPQCQSSWVTYLSSLYGLPNGTDDLSAQEPSCSQADITGTLCSQVNSKRLENYYNYGGGDDAYTYISDTETVTTGGSTITTTAISSLWLSNSSAAPGCTVGCQSCRVSGNQVQLFYWPPATVNASQEGPVTAIGFGTTFTSPTVYISFDALSASDSCSAIGTSMRNVIVAITNTATLSSIYGWGSPNGAYDGPQDFSASFNLNDLYQTPVPDSIYESQPRCSSTLFSIWSNCGSFTQFDSGATANLPASICNSAYTCPRSLPYEPVVSVPSEVQELQAAWAGCIGALRGVYDPPKALTAGVLAVEPTSLSFISVPTSPSDPGQGTTTKAAPASTPISPASPTTPARGSSPSSDSGAGGSSSSNNNGGSGSNNGGSGNSNGGSGNNDGGSGNSNVGSSNSNGGSSNNGGNGSGQGGQGGSGSSPGNQSPNGGQSGSSSPGNSGGSSGGQGGSSSSSSGQNGGTGSQVGSNGSGQSGQGAGQSDGQSGGGQASGQQGSSNGAAGSGSQSIENGSQENQGIAAGSGAVATFQGAGGAAFSAQSQGSNVVIAAPRTTATIANGQSATIAGQTIANKGNGIALDGSSVAVPAAAAASPPSSGAASIFTLPNGDSVTAQAQGGNIVAHAGSSSVTLSPGGTAVINGQTLSAPSAGGGIVDGSLTHSLATAGPSAGAAGAIFTGQDGQVFSVSTESNGNIDVVGKSTTATLTPGGRASVVDGKTLRANSSGGGLLVDGSTVGSATASSTALGTIVPARSNAVSTRGGSDRGLAIFIVVSGATLVIAIVL